MGKLATAQDLINTGAFSFNTSSSTVINYVPSLSVVPSAAKIRAALKSGYNLTWSVPSAATCCVPLDEVTYAKAKAVGKLTLNYTSAFAGYAYMMTGGYTFKQYTSIPSNASELSSNGTAFTTGANKSCGPENNNVAFEAKLANTSTSYIAGGYVMSDYSFVIIYAQITSSQISTLNNGGSVTLTMSYKKV